MFMLHNEAFQSQHVSPDPAKNFPDKPLSQPVASQSEDYDSKLFLRQLTGFTRRLVILKAGW